MTDWRGLELVRARERLAARRRMDAAYLALEAEGERSALEVLRQGARGLGEDEGDGVVEQ